METKSFPKWSRVSVEVFSEDIKDTNTTNHTKYLLITPFVQGLLSFMLKKKKE